MVNRNQISFVMTRFYRDKQMEEASVDVRGNYSTKIESIVRQVVLLTKNDRTAKCLIFSTWNDVLDLLAGALRENRIQFAYLQSGGGRFQQNLMQFKTNPECRYEAFKLLILELKLFLLV